MTILGLILNMIGVAIVGLQKYDTPFDGGNVPRNPRLNKIGWISMFLGFALMLIAEIKKVS